MGVPVLFDKVKVGSTIFYNHLIWFKVTDHFFNLLDVSKLRGGLYLLVMTDEEGARVTRRFVKNL